MVIQNSDLYVKEISTIQNLPTPSEKYGKMRVLRAKVVAATWTYASANLANLFKAPKGFRLIEGFMETDGLGTSCTIALGYTSAAYDDIIAATAMASAGRVQLPKLASIGLDIGGQDIKAILGGANATDGKILTVVLVGVVD